MKIKKEGILNVAAFVSGLFLTGVFVRLGWEGGKVLNDAQDRACEKLAIAITEHREKKALKKANETISEDEES